MEDINDKIGIILGSTKPDAMVKPLQNGFII